MAMENQPASDEPSNGPSNNQILLRWNDSESFLSGQIRKLWRKMEMTDVILSCEGQIFKAHKIILSLWSPYFEQLFQATSKCKENAFPVIIFRDTLASDLGLILQFVYQGQVFIGQKDAERFLKTAEMLQVAGLSEQIKSCTAAVINAPASTSTPTSGDKDKNSTATSVSKDFETDKTANNATNASATSTSTPVVKSCKVYSIKPRLEKAIPDSAAANTWTDLDNQIQRLEAPSTESIAPGQINGQTYTSACSFTSSSFITSTPVQNIRPATTEEIMMSQCQAMHYQMEPIPMHEVQEAVDAVAAAAANGESAPVMLLSLNQHGEYAEPEQTRNGIDVSSNSALYTVAEPGSTITQSFSYIVPELEHQYSSFSTSYDDAMIQSVQEQQPQGISGAYPQQPLQEKSNRPKTCGEFIKITKSGVINSKGLTAYPDVPIRYVPCGTCGKQVKEQSLKVHMKRTHLAEGINFVQCPICPKKLKSKGVYYKHMFCHRQRGEMAPKVAKSKRQSAKRSLAAKSPKISRQNAKQNANNKVVVYKSDQQGAAAAAGLSVINQEPVIGNVIPGAGVGANNDNDIIMGPTYQVQVQQEQQQEFQYEQL